MKKRQKLLTDEPIAAASLQTAAGLKVLQPGSATTIQVSPSDRQPAFTMRCCKLISDQFSKPPPGSPPVCS